MALTGDPVVFNQQQLLSAACDDVELANQIIEVFLCDIPEQFANLREAVINGDLAVAERISHSIKGASATVGGERLRDAAHEAEKAGREGNMDLIKSALPIMEREFNDLREKILISGE